MAQQSKHLIWLSQLFLAAEPDLYSTFKVVCLVLASLFLSLVNAGNDNEITQPYNKKIKKTFGNSFDKQQEFFLR